MLGALAQVREVIVLRPVDSLKVALPAGLYALQNNLVFFGVSNLSVPVFQVTNQLKVFTTAILSVILLQRSLNGRKWLALCLLFVGISLVQLDVVGYGRSAPITSSSPSSASSPSSSSSSSGPEQRPVLGTVAVVISAFTSGFAGVYFEKMLKGSTASVWLRNVQLGLAGTVFGLIIAYVNDGAAMADRGFFAGWSTLATVIVMDHALGGLIIAVAIKYADNILKTFAMSLSIIVSSVLSIFIFGFSVSFVFAAGTALVLSSTFMYEQPTVSASAPTLPR